MALYPMPDAAAQNPSASLDKQTHQELELEAYYQVIKDYEPDT